MTTTTTTTALPRPRAPWLLLPMAFATVLTLGWHVPDAAARVCLKFLADCCKSSTDTCNCVRTRGCLKACSDISQCATAASLEEPAFDTTATVGATGKRIAVRGPLKCSADAPLKSLRVTVEQNGFVAEGRTKGRCPAAGGQWQAVVRSRGGAIFGVGPAFACAIAQVGGSGDVPDTEQWCSEITIVAE